jgi:hypothetical protein
MFMQRKVESILKFLIALGLFLLATNIIGFFYYTTINESISGDVRPENLTEKEFWRVSNKSNNESIEEYVRRLTKLVSDRMIIVDPKNAKPTFFENYILWGYAQYLDLYEWNDTKKAVRLGGGFCSQHAVVFDNILKQQGIISRILGLNGHILNEVIINGKWFVFDPQYNLVFKQSMKELENDSRNTVYEAYMGIGLSEQNAMHFQKVFTTDVDNWHFNTSKSYSMIGYLVEKMALYLVWIFPVCLIFMGSLIRYYAIKKP